MRDLIAEAVIEAAEHGAPPKVWQVSPDASADFGAGRNPFDGATFTAWELPEVMTGRTE